MVNPNGIHTKFLHECNVPEALFGVDQRIFRSKLIRNT
jgi:hypothetical protein